MRRVFAAILGAAAMAALSAQPASVVAADSTVTISQGVDADTLDPLKTAVTPSDNVQRQLFETLMVHDPQGKIVPLLATSWKRVQPTVWEFKLRRDVKFWNGDPLTSTDVKFSIEKIKDPAYKSQLAPRATLIESVETPDAYTVRFATKRPTAQTPGLQGQLYIVDAKYWKEHGDAYQAEHPMGTGPYVFNQWRKDEQIVLDANPKYWGGAPSVTHVVWKPIPESASRVAALKTGETDLITNVPVQYGKSLGNGQNTRMISTKSLRVLYIGFNTLQPGPQQNRLVRQAFNYAVDVPSIIKNVLGGYGYQVAAPLPAIAGFTGYDPTIAPYKYDLAKAKALLAQAGYPEGSGLDMVLNSPTGRYNKDKEVAEAIAGQLAAIGVKATVKTQEWTTYLALNNQKALTPMYELGWGNATYDADNTLTSLLATTSRLSTYSNPELDKILEDARYELDPAKRQQLYSRALHIIHDDAPWIFLFEYEDLYATSSRIEWQARPDEVIDCKTIKLRT